MFPAERYKKILKENFEKVFPPKPPSIWNIRVNTLKISVEELKEKLEKKNCEIEEIPWVKEGFWVRNCDLSKSIEHILGYFFIQNASSMIPPLVLNPEKNDTILDLCAAPGAKTTQMAAMMKNQGLIIANDVHLKRLKALRGNLQRCGVTNTITTLMNGKSFWKTGLKFKKILLDVPCSGSGTLNPRVFKQLSFGALKMLSSIQKKLLISASKCLEKGGTIVYSTCSLEPEENEEVIDFAIKKLGLKTKKIEIEAPFVHAFSKWEEKEFDDSVTKAIRIIPSEKTEGFFVCKLVK